MAFGFIKKVFSFGKKEVVEEKVDEQAPLPPIKWDSLAALKDAPPSPSPQAEGPERREGDGVAEDKGTAETTPTGASAHLPLERAEPELGPAQPPAPPKPQPDIPSPPVEPQPAPTPPEPQPQPSPEEPTPAPTPAEPVPSPAPEEPAPTPSPAEPEQPPAEIPVPPNETPGAPPVEIPARTAEPEAAPSPSPLRAGPVGKVDQGGVAERLSTAEATPPAPSTHYPLKGGESAPTPGKVTVAKSVEKKAEPQKTPEPAPRITWFQRLREGLSRSSKELSSNIAGVFLKRKLDEDTLQDLEDVLIRADLGTETAIRITDALASGRYGKDVSEGEVRTIMAEEVEKVLGPVALPLELDLSHKPHVILVVGVNGTGKTTTIGKLAAKLATGGLSVTLAAGDTFRAAAIEQLKIWGERTGSPVVASKLGADAAGLAYDAFEKAKQAGSDVLIIDTAGRLQNKAELMAELEKIVRVLGKLDPEAPHTVLQTVDATTGQNALNQVEIFRNVAGVNGLVMTKLDGTARGGILVAIAAKHRLPVYFIGVGEQVDDLEPFSASDFAKAIAGVA
jgi:fused signal recognition particle receptor